MKKARVVWAFIQATRPRLTLLGVLASLGLLHWAGHLETDLTRSVLTVLLVFGANLTWNLYAELRDRKLDRIARSERPLPSGQVSIFRVYQVFFVLFLFSVGLNIIMVGLYGSLYLVGLLGHWSAYTYVSGRKDLVGNGLMGVAYGAAAFISLYPKFLLFSLAFFFWSFGYNITQQYQKFEGERAVGVVTVPTQFSELPMFLFTEFLLACSLIQFLWLYLETFYVPLLILIVSNVAISLSAYSIVAEMAEEKKRACERLRQIQKTTLIVGFLAMLFWI